MSHHHDEIEEFAAQVMFELELLIEDERWDRLRHRFGPIFFTATGAMFAAGPVDG